MEKNLEHEQFSSQAETKNLNVKLNVVSLDGDEVVEFLFEKQTVSPWLNFCASRPVRGISYRWLEDIFEE